MKLSTNVEIKIIDKNGRILRTEYLHNIVTNAGFNFIRDILRGVVTSNLVLTHFGIGTGTTPVAVTDTTLETETFRDEMTSFTANNAQLICSYYLGLDDCNGTTISEAGILNQATLGVLFAHILFTPIVKTNSISVSFVWVINMEEG